MDERVRAEGVGWLLRRTRATGEQEMAAAGRIIDMLYGFPLALELAAASITATDTRLTDYATRLADQAATMASSTDGPTTQAVRQVCALTLAAVEAINPGAVRLLNTAAWLCPVVPSALLVGLFDGDEPAVDEALGLLNAYGMVTLTGGEARLDETVQSVLRETHTTDWTEIHPHAERAMMLVRHAAPSGNPRTDTASWPIWASLIPQIAALHDHLSLVSSPHLTWLLFQASEYLSARSADYEATLGPSHPDTLASRDTLASLLYDQDRYAEAEAEYRAVLAIRTRTLGAEHPDTLTSREHVGLVLYGQERYEEAEAEDRAVLEIRTRTLGADHRDTLSTRISLALTLQEQDRYGEAVAQWRAVRDVWSRIVDADDPVIRMIHDNVALARYLEGRYGEAEAEYRAILDIWTRTLGAEHPTTLASRDRVAEALANQGRHTDAEAEYRAVVDIRTRVLGVDHDETRRSEHALQGLLIDQGRWDEYRQRVRAREQA